LYGAEADDPKGRIEPQADTMASILDASDHGDIPPNWITPVIEVHHVNSLFLE
jgi:hypothetical protein